MQSGSVLGRTRPPRGRAAHERRERGLALRGARGRVLRLTKLILDVDTGTDDAIAIMLAALDPRLELLAVTTVAGNASIDHTTENTLRVLQHIGADVPVHRGAPGPLLPSTAVRDHADAGRRIHGEYLDLAGAFERTRDSGGSSSSSTPSTSGSDVTLVPTGPLTNVATALRLDPGLAERIPRARADGRRPRPRERDSRPPSTTSGPTPRRRGSCC